MPKGVRTDWTVFKEIQQIVTDWHYANECVVIPKGAKVSEDIVHGRLYSHAKALEDIRHAMGLPGAKRRRFAMDPITPPKNG